jgi:hypothetical protein
MGKRLVIAVFGMAVIYTPQVWAGTGGPGWASRLGGNTPAQQADDTYSRDLAAAKDCQDHPRIMHTLLACRQAMARHPEMFAKPTSATLH